jgi:GT2 family glycosyltransferase
VKLSVVVAAWNGPAFLRECLRSLAGQIGPGGEIVIAANFEENGIEDLVQTSPFVHFFCFQGATVPELRTRGIEKSHGEIVALLEDHCVVGEGWAKEIQKAIELSYPVVGGCVENASSGSLNWAVYFYDYGKYMLPDRARVVDSLSGNNVAYKREALARIRDQYRRGFYETFVHQELQRRGCDLYLTPSAVIYHTKRYALRSSILESYHHGRSFAARRFAKAGLVERTTRGAASLLLPALLPLRIVTRTLQKKRHLKELMRAMPNLLLLTTAWSYGEFRGCVSGEGASAGRWK